MPRMEGLELLSRLREKSQLPVIFLTSKDDEIDEALGLAMGADDYIAKPFSQRLVIARIRAILRRVELNRSAPEGDDEAVKRMFTPEFRNRLDAIVPFSYLPPEVVARVVEKFILQLELQLADREVHITLDDDAKAWLTERGYDRLYGARPMGRLIQEKIKQPLAEELLFGKLVHGGEVHVRLKDNALNFEITPAAPKRPRKGRGAKKTTAKAK